MLIYLVILIIVAEFLITGSFSAPILSLMVLFICSLIFCDKDKDQKQIILYVFSLTSILAILHYADISFNNVYTFYDEGNHYFPMVESGLKKLYLSNIFDIEDFILFKDSIGYHFYIISWGYLCNFLGEYNHLSQLMSSVFVSCIYGALFYKILKTAGFNDAYKSTIVFMTFTPFILYSYVLLRDSLIALFYLLGIWVIVKQYNLLRTILLLLFFAILTASVRFEHGIFYAVLILYSLYVKLRKRKVLFYILVFVSVSFCLSYILDSIILAEETINDYEEYAKNTASQTGFMVRVMGLPAPFKQIFCTIISQYFPIPGWSNFLYKDIPSFFSFIQELFVPIKVIVWGWVVFFVFVCLKTKKYGKYIRDKYGLLLLLSLMLIVAGSSEYYEERRFMCMYPIIYMAFLYAKQNIVEKHIYLMYKRNYLMIYMTLGVILTILMLIK